MKILNNAKALLLLTFLLYCFQPNLSAQNEYLVGYQRYIAGKKFVYHSLYSNTENSLLIRANQNFEPIEWETQVVPSSYNKKSVSFIWLYGIDVLPRNQKFDLSINDKKILQFSNPTSNDEKVWQVNGGNGIHLSFKQAMIDRHGDQMGFAVLTLPTRMITKGHPVKISVDGIDNKSDAWYMTYQVPLERTFSADQLKTVTKENNQLYHTIRFNYVHLGEPQEAFIGVENDQKSISLRTGLNEIDFLIPKVDKRTTVRTTFKLGAEIQEKEVPIEPVKEWTIYLVQHSHTDIGYTRPQSEILAAHLRYIDYALDYCDQTDHYPEESQFRWTCEASWAVREYLKSRPKAQTDRLIERIKQGRIEVTGMFFNFSEIVDETALAIQLQSLKQFKEQGIDVTAAMQNDVNGIGWCMVDMYHNTGVKYLTMGQHGHRAHVPFKKPTSFWWESPSGKRLLAYRSEHYMHGNALALTNGKIDVFRNNLSKYLTDLEGKGYPIDRTAIQFSGYITDNSPPSTKACDIVEEWNKKYEWPKLKLALASEFMVYVDKNHPEILETKKVAWPDWWTDGTGSAMNETKTSRIAHTEMVATMGLFAMAQIAGTPVPAEILKDITTCYDNLLFYAEHTFGADESITNPTSENSKNQWSQKSSYVWMANQQSNLLREKAMGLIAPYVALPEEPSVTVFNTLNWDRSGLVEAFIYHDVLPLDKKFQIIDEKGNQVPAQIIKSRSEGSYWALWVEDIPAMGYSNLTIKVLDQTIASQSRNQPKVNVLENEYYKIVIDEEKQGITSIVDKALNKELVDPNCAYPLGSFIYETIGHRGELERLTNTVRDTVYKPINRQLYTFTEFKIVDVYDEEIWTSIICNGKLAECVDDKGVQIEVRLYKQTKNIELLYQLNKHSNTDPEAMYVAFPFVRDDEDELVFEVQGGVVRPGIDQLEGTASDWNTIQNFAAVKSDNSQIIFCSNDIPLVQFGNINTGRFYYQHEPENGHIYSWVLNNYWVTNFKADQSGELSWKYQITSTKDPSNTAATKFGWGNRIPMVTRTSSGTEKAVIQETKNFINLNTSNNLLLVSARPSPEGDGIILHLRETEGDHAILDISKLLQNESIKAIYEVNAIGEKIKSLSSPYLIEHFETKFFLLELIK